MYMYFQSQRFVLVTPGQSAYLVIQHTWPIIGESVTLYSQLHVHLHVYIQRTVHVSVIQVLNMATTRPHRSARPCDNTLIFYEIDSTMSIVFTSYLTKNEDNKVQIGMDVIAPSNEGDTP